jgi:hypothetical protein
MNGKLIAAIIIILIAIQFIRAPKNVSFAASASNITRHYATPDDVQLLIKNACYDCHSNNTKYPWYSNLQPVYWWMNGHIEDGKKHLNFDAFSTYTAARQYKKMADIVDEIKTGDMPLPSYSIQHKEVRLSDNDKQKIYNWCAVVRKQMETIYPKDSLTNIK